MATYPLPIEKDKISEDSVNYFLLQACLTGIRTSFHQMKTDAPELVYAQVKTILQNFFKEEKNAAAELNIQQEQGRKPVLKERDHAFETLQQLIAQDASQNQDVKELLEFINSTVGVNLKLKQAEIEALERALEDEFDYELEIREGLRYG